MVVQWDHIDDDIANGNQGNKTKEAMSRPNIKNLRTKKDTGSECARCTHSWSVHIWVLIINYLMPKQIWHIMPGRQTI